MPTISPLSGMAEPPVSARKSITRDLISAREMETGRSPLAAFHFHEGWGKNGRTHGSRLSHGSAAGKNAQAERTQ